MFLVGYDYGNGGIWRVIAAVNKSQIVERYPELIITDGKPDWMSNNMLADLHEKFICIEDRENEFFKNIVSSR
jgi:hypothetical protein